ncbi:MAG TPA: rhodanese-like domain-containing protein [Bacteroidia bacterium]|nr:rhodanese-like domain-containing protein [Bacteroidia bacterium]
MKSSLLFFFLLAFASVAGAQKVCDTVTHVLSADSFKIMTGRHDGVVLDVRTPDEFRTGYISGAVNIDFRAADFEAEISKLDKTKTYYVYCEVGGRSRMAADYMTSHGFCQVYVLERGLRDWKQKGYPVTVPK